MRAISTSLFLLLLAAGCSPTTGEGEQADSASPSTVPEQSTVLRSNTTGQEAVTATTWEYIHDGQTFTVSSNDVDFVDEKPYFVPLLGDPAGCGMLDNLPAYVDAETVPDFYVQHLRSSCVLIPDIDYQKLDLEQRSQATKDLLSFGYPDFFTNLGTTEIPILAATYCELNESLSVSEITEGINSIQKESEAIAEEVVTSFIRVWC